MFFNQRPICQLFGIPVFLDFSLIILIVLFLMDFGSFTLGLACALALLVSITLHELGHALTASAFGYHAQKITLSLLGGCASFINLPRKAYQEFLVAVAGPAVSFLISGVMFAVLAFLPVENAWLQGVLFYTLWMNFWLGLFNLLPGFPLDGGRIFRSFLQVFTDRRRATFVAMVVGRVIAVLLAAWGVWEIVHTGRWGWVTVLIAWMIWREGYREYQLALMEENFYGHFDDYTARVSPPPYGRRDDDDEVDIHRN